MTASIRSRAPSNSIQSPAVPPAPAPPTAAPRPLPAATGSLNGVATPLSGTNCNICVANPDDGTPMLPAGKYVVEAVMPPGFEIVKEEDKNILMGDIYIAPVSQQFAGLGNVFILPDQAAVNAYYNANNPLNATTNLGVLHTRAGFERSAQVW